MTSEIQREKFLIKLSYQYLQYPVKHTLGKEIRSIRVSGSGNCKSWFLHSCTEPKVLRDTLVRVWTINYEGKWQFVTVCINYAQQTIRGNILKNS